MYEIRICMEVNGLAEDENGNACPAGVCVSIGYNGEKELNDKEYRKFMEQVSIQGVLKQTGLYGFVNPEDCRLITPKEYDELYGDDL